MVNNTSYREQFNAVEQCFKVIGFTLEVRARRASGGSGNAAWTLAHVNKRLLQCELTAVAWNSES